MTITSGSNKAIVNYDTFNIANDETVNMNLPSSNAAILNRVTGGSPSEILGSMNSNGTVFLVNPSGIVFGAGAQVNVGSMVASTLSISDHDFLNGNYTFRQEPGQLPGTVENHGVIQAASGGYVALIGSAVQNTGTITAPQGTVAMAVGDTVQLHVDDLTSVQVSVDEALEEQVEEVQDAVLNTGTIAAQGGTAQLVANLQADLYERAVNNTGRIEAQGVDFQDDGTIILQGTNTAGTAIVENSGDLDVTHQNGTGGIIHVLGDRVALTGEADLDASGTAGGGEILVGGDTRGANADIYNAQMTYIGENVALTADGTEWGDGGKIAIWADDVSRVYGELSVQGGSHGGDGGFVETSGKNYLEVLNAPKIGARHGSGSGGTWLLDPRDIDIVAGAGNVNINGASPFVSFGDTAQLGVNLILAALAGGDVTVETGATGGEAGNIQLLTDLDFDGISAGLDRTLTLRAHNDIVLSSDVLDSNLGTGDQLNLVLNANIDNVGGGTVQLSGVNVSTSGGDFTATNQGGGVTGSAISFTGGAVLNTGGGDIYLEGTTGAANDGVYATAGSQILSDGGSVTLIGVSNTGAGVFGNNGSILDSNGGALSITGTSTAGRGVYIDIGTTVRSGGSSLTLAGTSSGAGEGIYIDDISVVDSEGGSLTLTGVSDTSQGIDIVDTSSVSSGGGDIVFTGTSNTHYGLIVDNSASVTSGGGDITMTGNSTNERGIRFDLGASIQSGGGDIWVTGGSTADVAVYIDDLSTVNSDGGSLTLVGTSVNDQGIRLDNGSTLLSGGGGISISGTSDDLEGIRIDDGSTIDSSGGMISLTGVSDNFRGINLDLNSTLDSDGGAITVTGTSNLDSGIYVDDNSVIQSGGGDLTLTGTSSVYRGVYIVDSSTIDSEGGVLTVSATSTSDRALLLDNSAVVRSGGGNISVTGQSTTDYGMEIRNAQLDSEGGNLTINGTSTNRRGIYFRTGAQIQSGGGVLNITGTSVNDDGILFIDAGTTVDSEGGDVTLTGSSTDDVGVSIIDDAILQTQGGDLTINGTSVDDEGVYLNNNSQVLTQSGDMAVIAHSDDYAAWTQENGAVVNTQSGNFTISGTSDTFVGVRFSSNAQLLTGDGEISITGVSQSGSDGVSMNTGATMNSGGGNIVIDGQSLNLGDDGFQMNNGSQMVSGGGSITVSGISNNSDAIYLDNTSIMNSGGGDISLTGRATSGGENGVRIGNNSQVLSSGGDIRLDGVGDDADGVDLFLGTTVDADGGNITILGVATDDEGVDMNDVTVQTTTGDIFVSAQRTTKGATSELLLRNGTGVMQTTGGDITLVADQMEIQFNSVAANAGTITLRTRTGVNVELGSNITPNGPDPVTTLDVNADELGRLSARTLVIDQGTRGGVISLADDLNLTALGYDLELQSTQGVDLNNHALTMGSRDAIFQVRNGNIDLGNSLVQGVNGSLLELIALGGSSMTQSSGGELSVDRLFVTASSGSVNLTQGQNDTSRVRLTNSSGHIRYTSQGSLLLESSTAGTGQLSVHVEGSGHLTNLGTLKGNRFNATTQNGNVSLTTSLKRLNVEASGDITLVQSGDLRVGSLSGQALDLTVEGCVLDDNGSAVNLTSRQGMTLDIGGSLGTRDNAIEIALLGSQRIDATIEGKDGLQLNVDALDTDYDALNLENGITGQIIWNDQPRNQVRNRDLFLVVQNKWIQDGVSFGNGTAHIIQGTGSLSSLLEQPSVIIDSQQLIQGSKSSIREGPEGKSSQTSYSLEQDFDQEEYPPKWWQDELNKQNEPAKDAKQLSILSRR